MILTSYLQNVFFSKDEKKKILHQALITSAAEYADWSAFIAGFATEGTYPHPSSNKFETYGWTPTLFRESENKNGVTDYWRKAPAAEDFLTLFVADLDNDKEANPYVTFSDVQQYLTNAGLNHLLYTSFSHTNEKHKVRIVIPVTRWITPDEAFQLFNFFNDIFNAQLDKAVYGDGDFLYGPNKLSQTASAAHLNSLDVEEYLDRAAALPEHLRPLRKASSQSQPITPAQAAVNTQQLAKMAIGEGVTITNPVYFNQKWIGDLHSRSIDGSISRTILALLGRAVVKAKCKNREDPSHPLLTKGDVLMLFYELDAIVGGYVRRKYSTAAIDHDIVSAMSAEPQN